MGKQKTSGHKRDNYRSGRTKSQAQRIDLAQLSKRSYEARDRAINAIAWKRRNPKQSFAHAAKMHGVKLATVKKYFPSALRKVGGKLQVATADRYLATLYVPDENGNAVPVHTRSSKDRKALSGYLRDLGRYLRGKRDALAPWRGKTVAGVALVTSRDVLVSIEAALSEFSLYRSNNGGS
jgi:hypothetical protein